MISEGSCDTGDWSDDAKNFTLEYKKYKFHFRIY